MQFVLAKRQLRSASLFLTITLLAAGSPARAHIEPAVDLRLRQAWDAYIAASFAVIYRYDGRKAPAICPSPRRQATTSADFCNYDGLVRSIRRQFTGKLRDYESGLKLDYFGARYYSGAMGRFLSPDEPFVDQNLFDPQSWNLYSYVRSNPLSNVDPTGQSCVDSSGSVVPDEEGSGAIGDDGDGQGCGQVGVKPSTDEERAKGEDIEPSDTDVEGEPGSLLAYFFAPAVPRYVPNDVPLSGAASQVGADVYRRTQAVNVVCDGTVSVFGGVKVAQAGPVGIVMGASVDQRGDVAFFGGAGGKSSVGDGSVGAFGRVSTSNSNPVGVVIPVQIPTPIPGLTVGPAVGFSHGGVAEGIGVGFGRGVAGITGRLAFDGACPSMY